MKLFDRYVAASFLRNYLISFLVLVGMYVVLDMIFNFDELVEVNARQGLSGMEAALNFAVYVGDYYAYQAFLYFLHLSGIIPVVAATFTIMRMVRFNELSALLSAGVPLLRVAMPIILVSLLLNGLMWADQELVVPNIVEKLVRSHDYGASTGYFPIAAMPDGRTGKLYAARYHPEAHRMEHLDVVQTDEAGQPIAHIRADAAEWDAARKGWRLKQGVRTVNLSPASGLPVQYQPADFYQSNVTPEEIQLYRSSDFVDLLSTARINELLKRPMDYGRSHLLRVKHSRGVAQIVLNMVMLLLAISAVLTRDPQHLKLAASKCVILCGACLSLAFMGQELAGQPPPIPALADKWPALMAWLPVFLYGPLAIWLLDRVKT